MKAPVLEASQFAQVLSHVATMQRPEHYRLLVLLMRDLGLRPMELAGLDSTWFRGNELRIPLGHSKRKEGRSLPLSSEILDAFAAHMQGRVGRVFVNRQAQPFTATTMSDNVRRLFREAGVQGSCYSGRRTLATRLVDEGANILVVQAVLGHKGPLTTLAYVGVTQNMVAKALFKQAA